MWNKCRVHRRKLDNHLGCLSYVISHAFYALELQEWNTGKFKPRPWPAFHISQPYCKCRRSTHLKRGKNKVCHYSGSRCPHLYLNFTSLAHWCGTNLFVLLVIFIANIQFSISLPVIAFRGWEPFVSFKICSLLHLRYCFRVADMFPNS